MLFRESSPSGVSWATCLHARPKLEELQAHGAEDLLQLGPRLRAVMSLRGQRPPPQPRPPLLHFYLQARRQ